MALILGINLVPLAPAFATFGDGTPTIPNPNVFTEFSLPKIDGASGAFTQRIPLDIPPGRSGLQPDVTLDYNSQRTQDSIVGYGWQLSIPYIQRLNKTGSQNLYATSSPYFTSSVDGELVSLATSNPATTSPTILDSLPLALYQTPVSTSDSRPYTVPAGGSNKLFVVMLANGGGSASPSATLNGAALTFVRINGSASEAYYYVGYLANPTSGTFTINWSSSTNSDYSLLTLSGAAQSNPIDDSSVTTTYGTSQSTSVTTSQGNDLLLSFPDYGGADSASTLGTGETRTITAQAAQLGYVTGAYKQAGSTAGTETMTTSVSSTRYLDEPVVAIKALAMTPVGGMSTTTIYAYAQTGWANPDAVTQLSTGYSTTTYSYDANGNLLQAGGWSYMWDYLNRMLASGFNNSTTTYAYDPSGARVLQTSTTSTTYYPNKFYSFTSTKIGANTYATSTNYIWNNDTLLATIDQPLYNGSATGSPITRYIHPDHLGSTNAVTDQNGSLVQLMDYYPYGAARIATSTYPTNEKRQYIGQFSDAQTNLNYLIARYYDGVRGQFISQDPVSWEMGLTQDGKSALANPQTQNSYSYASDNPIVNKDALGRFAVGLGLNGGGNIPGMYGEFSTMPVLVVGTHPFNVEVGVMDSGGGGGATAILGADLKGQFMYSPSAQNIQDLRGVDVTTGASIKYGVDVGYDVSMSKSDKPNKPVMTYTGSLGIGGVATPYALPVEVHGGINYSKPIMQYNLTPAITTARSNTISGAQNVYAYIQAQINNIQQQIQALQNQAPQCKISPSQTTKK